MDEGRSFIESQKFPIEVVNEASAKEKTSGGRPAYWEMAFYWTRKPLASARAIIAGALLSEDYSLKSFIENLRLNNAYDYWCPRCLKGYNSKEIKGKVKTCPQCHGRLIKREKVPHALNPTFPQDDYEKYFKGKSLLDPFAGFGSIPLEALRLGLSKVVAVELLPVSYIFLKAVLEYPLKYGKEFVKVKDKKGKEKLVSKLEMDVKKWGEWIVEQLKNDPDIKELYDDDVAVYIGTWEIKCPHCGKWTPLIGNWWLARVEDDKGWKALLWMKPVKRDDKVEIEVVDARMFSPTLKGIQLVKKGKRIVGIKVNGKVEHVGWEKLEGEPNIDAKAEKAVCLQCGAEIRNKVKDNETGKVVWYVKYALRTYNRILEDYLENRVELNEFKENAYARLRLLVKVKVNDGTLEFESATEEDNEKLWKALEKLRELWNDPDVPKEPIPPYGHKGGGLRFPTYIITRWYQLFNPRQLITLIKLVKLIRDAGKRIEEEKLKEGLSGDKAFEYAEVIATYLAIALIRFVDHNNLVTLLHPSSPMGIEVAHALSMRGLAMQWNWGDTNPIITSKGLLRTNSFDKCLEKIKSGLTYLLLAASNSSTKVRASLDDATTLSKLSENEKFDLIVTDPPYYDDVSYSELSDFYYVWLKRALSDNNGYSLIPRFHKEAFFDEWDNEIETQWSTFSRSEITLNTARLEYFGLIQRKDKKIEEEGKILYTEMLARSFENMTKRLKDDGLLITYFAHSDPDAWRSLIYSGWQRAGLRISKAYPVLTESEESVVARGKSAITASIVVVWCKSKVETTLDISAQRDNIVDTLANRTREYLQMGLRGATLYTMLYASALSELTKASKVVDGAKELSVDDIILEGSRLTIKAIAKGASPDIVSKEAILYLVFKLVGTKPEEGARRRLPSSDLLLIGYGTMSINDAIKSKTIRPTGKGGGAEVAKRKVFELLEPAEDSESAVLDVLGLKGIDPGKLDTIKSTVDVLHVLELYADRSRDVIREKYAEISKIHGWKAKEAIELAKAIAILGGDDDPEANRCRRLLEQLGIQISETKQGVFE